MNPQQGQMPTDPYAAWSFYVNLFVAIGTIGSVVVALFGNWIRLRILPPKLLIDLLNSEGEKIDITTPEGTRTDEARYYHLVVSNPHRWYTARNVDVRLLRVQEPAPGEEMRTTWSAVAPIQCRHQAYNPMKHDIGSPMHFDLCSVLKSGNLKLHPIFVPNNLQTVYKGPCDLTLTFQATSTEVDSKMVRIKISWDGKWTEGSKEMQDHLKIRVE